MARWYATGALIFLLCGLWARGAHAQERGTHFLLEVHGGIAGKGADYLDVGWSFGGLVGIGAKFRGLPPRFYAIASYRSSFYVGEGVHYATGLQYDAAESDHELGAGLRLVLPLWSRVFRFYADVLAGSAARRASLRREGERLLHTTDWAEFLALGAGLQARWHPSASVGLRLEWSQAGGGANLVAAAAGASASTDRWAIYLSNAWHF